MFEDAGPKTHSVLFAVPVSTWESSGIHFALDSLAIVSDPIATAAIYNVIVMLVIC